MLPHRNRTARPGSIAAAVIAVATLAAMPARSANAQGRAATAAPSAYDEAQALIGQKRYAEALDKLRAVTTERPDFAPGWFARGLAARRAGQCADAIPAYRKYAALAPAEAEPYFGLGLCLRDTGDRPAAVAALRRFVELERRPGQEKWVETARGLIASLETPGTVTVAVASPAPAAPGAPMAAGAPAIVPGQVTPPPMFVPLAPPPVVTDPTTSTPAPAPAPRPSESSRAVERAVPAADRTKANAAYEDAQRLRDAGKVDAALNKFGEAVARNPDLHAARAAWGELLIKLHREADAVAVLRAAVERSPQYALAWYELGFALRETARYADAVEAYRRYIGLRPTDPDPHYGVARALQKMGRDDEAARSFATYLSLENRPGEERWVASAKVELATLSQRSNTRAAAAPARASAAPRPAVIAAPPATSAPSAATADRASAPPR